MYSTNSWPTNVIGIEVYLLLCLSLRTMDMDQLNGTNTLLNTKKWCWSEVIFKGTVPQKFASNKVSTCSGCCCGILQLCNVCKGGLGGLNDTTYHQYLRNVSRKIALLKSFISATSKEPNYHSFWATELILVSKEAEFCDLQSYTEFF